jgi:hypothetical protein
MARKTITQTEARRLQQRVRQLEDMLGKQRNAYVRDWPDGIHLGSIAMNERPRLLGGIETARKLKHAIVVTTDNLSLNVYAVPLAKVPE